MPQTGEHPWELLSRISAATDCIDIRFGSGHHILYYAVVNNDKDFVAKCCKSLRSNQMVMILHNRNSDGRTPLGAAIERGYLEIIDILLEAGCDPASLQAFVSDPNQTHERTLLLTTVRFVHRCASFIRNGEPAWSVAYSKGLKDLGLKLQGLAYMQSVQRSAGVAMMEDEAEGFNSLFSPE
jgi:hypothetical protein